MSKLHILEQIGLNLYNVVVHATTPVGNNSAGTSWAVALVNSGMAVTTMSVGNGPGQISTAESNTVANGSVIEARFQWQEDPTWDAATRDNDLTIRSNQAVAGAITDMQRILKQFGRVVA